MFSVFFSQSIQFKVDRPQTTVVAKNLSVLQLFISRMPKMCAILQLVSAPLNPIPIAEHFRRSHPQCEHSCEQHIYMSKENNVQLINEGTFFFSANLRGEHVQQNCAITD